jgi:signal transduction histidine kinase
VEAADASVTEPARTAPGPDSGAAALDRAFPVVRALELIDAWQREPTEERRQAVAEALRRIVEVGGARGAVLEITAPPLPHLELAVGSLAEMASTTGASDGARGPDAEFLLGGDGGHGPLGRLLLQAPGAEGEALARALSLAVDAAWSRAVVHGRAERLEALEAATRAIAGELDVDRVLQVIVDRLRELVRARYAALGITDGRGLIERFVTSGISAEARAAIGAPPRGHGLLGLIVREARTLRATDIADHPASSGFPPHHPPMTSFLGAPVLLKGRSIGNLYLTDKQGGQSFTEEDERLVETFAIHAGIAIENARLHDLVQRIAIVEERERIGKDLHDGIIQSIYAVGLSLEDVPDLLEDDREEAVARVDRSIDALNLVISDIRSYILRLRPDLGREEDVLEALARLAEDFRMHAMVELEVDLEGGGAAARALAPDRRSDLLFIAREAISNVSRHAAASLAGLTLTATEEFLTMEVWDNGRGFVPEEQTGPDALGRHQGLQNMRDRAVGMGGTFRILSGSTVGTRIIVTVPASPDPALAAFRPNGTGDH